jgi:long-subunit acyl-CoA synthetase (AMP-forming)
MAPERLRALVRAEQAWLAASGARRFGLLAGNGREWAITDLALLTLGRVNVPLPWHFGPRQMSHALDTAGIDGVLTDTPERILALELGFTCAAESPQTGLAFLTRADAGAEDRPLPADTVKVTYTSGSTAEPRGVCLTRAALEAVARSVTAVAASLQIGRHLCVLPLATLLENVAGLYAAWLAGATCYLPSRAPGAIAGGTLTPQALLAEVGTCQPESMILVPELLRILVGGAESGWSPPPCARFFAVGGARVSPELLERATAVGLPVFEGYGLSECASVVCLNTPQAAKRGSVGRPLPHARLRLDPQGEIHVQGALMGGYVGAPSLGANAEIATGDLGELDAEGFVYVRGRLKNLFINSFGRNLSPEWIESELTQEPAIGQAVACGEAQPQIVALVAPAHAGVPAAAIAAAVRRANARLPAYARVARYHVMTERLTVANGLLTGNGRPRRERILERYLDTIAQLHAGAEPCPSTID